MFGFGVRERRILTCRTCKLFTPRPVLSVSHVSLPFYHFHTWPTCFGHDEPYEHRSKTNLQIFKHYIYLYQLITFMSLSN